MNALIDHKTALPTTYDALITTFMAPPTHYKVGKCHIYVYFTLGFIIKTIKHSYDTGCVKGFRPLV